MLFWKIYQCYRLYLILVIFHTYLILTLNPTHLPVNFNYFDIHKFHCSPEINSCSNKAFSLLSCNIRSIQANFDNLEQFLNDLNCPFNIISLSETWINRSNEQISNLDLPGYSFLSQPTTQREGGVGMYNKKVFNSVRHDLTSSTDESEML